MIVSEILHTKGTHVETAHADMTIYEAAWLLNTKGIGSLVICDRDASVLGIVEDHDIVRALAEHRNATLDLTVRTAMRRRPATCAPRDNLRDVMEKMTVHRARHLPVIEEGRLVGIISIGDIVKRRLTEMELEVNVLRDIARVCGRPR